MSAMVPYEIATVRGVLPDLPRQNAINSAYKGNVSNS